jgi:1-acyl-sn-glycerol-3-phosphate acyltransferase
MTAPGKSREEIQSWLQTAIASELRLAPGSLDVTRPFAFYGVDSLTAATLAGDLEEWLGHQLPPDVALARATIASLADRLSDRSRPASASTPSWRASDHVDYDALDYSRSPLVERLIKAAVRLIVRATSVVEVQGRERVPARGPVLLAGNHLHILDALWMTAVLPRRTIFLVAEEFQDKPVVGRLLNAGRAIYIARGKADRDALDRALAVLRGGGALAVAPEGRLSRTGGLIKGQSGIAYLSSQSGVPVLPVVGYGQERAGASWRRLTRVRVHIRFGRLVPVPTGPASPGELERYTDHEVACAAFAAALPGRVSAAGRRLTSAASPRTQPAHSASARSMSPRPSSISLFDCADENQSVPEKKLPTRRDGTTGTMEGSGREPAHRWPEASHRSFAQRISSSSLRFGVRKDSRHSSDATP